MPDVIAPGSSVDVAQEKIEGQQKKKATENVLVQTGQGHCHHEGGVPDPKERRAKTCQPRARKPPCDVTHQGQVGELSQKNPDVIRQPLQSEQRAEREKERTVAPGSPGSMDGGLEKRQEKITRAVNAAQQS